MKRKSPEEDKGSPAKIEKKRGHSYEEMMMGVLIGTIIFCSLGYVMTGSLTWGFPIPFISNIQKKSCQTHKNSKRIHKRRTFQVQWK